MAGQHREKFLTAQDKEIAELTKLEAWEVVDRASVPAHCNIMKSTWAFKIARLPDGLIKKLKARFCASGDTQIEGVDVFETYAPVLAV